MTMGFTEAFPAFTATFKYILKNTFMELFGKKIYYPFLLAAYPVLFLYSINWQYYSYYDILKPLLLSLLITLALFSAFNLAVRDGHKSSVLVSIFIILFFSYRHFYVLLKTIPALSHHSVYAVLSSAELIFYGVCAALIFLRPGAAAVFSDYLRVFSVILIALVAFNLSHAIVSDIQEYTTTYKNKTSLNKTLGQTSGSYRPDIYYIILDAYSGADSLLEFHNFDNSKFTSWLKSEGFSLPYRAHSNYCQTALSIPSSLNMGYIDDITDIIDKKKSYDLSPMKQLMANSAVADFLRSRGYKIVKFVFGYSITDAFKADVVEGSEGSFFLHEFTNQLANTTMLISIKSFVESEGELNVNARRVLSMVANLPVVADKIDSPKFVFAHIICPHPPFVFNMNGLTDKYKNVMPYTDNEKKFKSTRTLYMEGYLGQVEFINSRVKTVISKILKESKNPPIIIIQADHGCGVSYFSELSKTNVRERFSILNAYYLPEGGSRIIYDGITPVNSFRAIFDYYFGTRFGKLPDRSYYSWGSRPYVFTDITERLK
jgi:hypothetical protein